MSQLPTFDTYAKDWKFSIPKESIRPFVARLQQEEIFVLKPEDIAASIKAVAVVAAFQRPSDTSTQSHFRDIFEMLTFQGSADRDSKAPVLQSMGHFAAKSKGGAPEIQRMTVPMGAHMNW